MLGKFNVEVYLNYGACNLPCCLTGVVEGSGDEGMVDSCATVPGNNKDTFLPEEDGVLG